MTDDQIRQFLDAIDAFHADLKHCMSDSAFMTQAEYKAFSLSIESRIDDIMEHAFAISEAAEARDMHFVATRLASIADISVDCLKDIVPIEKIAACWPKHKSTDDVLILAQTLRQPNLAAVIQIAIDLQIPPVKPARPGTPPSSPKL